MADNYQKIGKLYTLGVTGITTITGASFIHGMYNASNAAATVIVDNAYQIHMVTDGSANFPVPFAFSNVRMSSTNTTGVILYS